MPTETASPHKQDRHPVPAMQAEAAPGAAGEAERHQSAREAPAANQPEPSAGPPEQQRQTLDPGLARPAVKVDTPASEDVVTDDGGRTPTAATSGGARPSPQGQFKCACCAPA